MKKSTLLFLLLPAIFGCSDDSGIFEPKQITLEAVLSENSTYSETDNLRFYQTSTNIEIPGDRNIKSVKIHKVVVSVVGYNSSMTETHCMLLSEHNIPSGISVDAYPFAAKEDFTGTVPYTDFLKGIAQNLKENQSAAIDFKTAGLDPETTFEIEIEINVDMTVEYTE